MRKVSYMPSRLLPGGMHMPHRATGAKLGKDGSGDTVASPKKSAVGFNQSFALLVLV